MKSSNRDLEECSTGLVFGLLLFSFCLIFLGGFIIYAFGSNVLDAIIGGYIYGGGNARMGIHSSKLTSGFEFWIALFVSISMLLLGMLFFTAAYFGIVTSIAEVIFRVKKMITK
ncbi:hypothetical protein [Rahnella sikkimica]|uniref:hypothetical protein n=1 Tax=Rahnella sikkimica TaxID=1805933 RepID=UPI0018659E4A|nr:hypothetical protein [Rahnella sikkimica]